MARTVYVRERVERAILTQLGTLSVANGYNTTIRLLTRRRGLPQHAKDTPEIRIMFGEGQLAPRSAGTGGNVWEIVAMGVMFAVPGGANMDEAPKEFNFLRGDIQKCLAPSGKTVLAVAAGAGTRLVDLVPNGDVPFFTEEVTPAIVMGMLVYEVRYGRCLADPGKFDDSDTVVTE